MPGSRWKC